MSPAEGDPPSLRRRALPIAVALSLVSLAGLLTDTVASSQVLALAGPVALSAFYPISGLLMGLSAVAQFSSIDSRPRLRVLRVVALGCGLGFLAALAWLAAGSTPAVAIGAVWVLGDQVQLLLPMLLWSLAGDVFNTAEANKVFGWILGCTYVAQLIGLLLTALAPLVLPDLGIPLPALLAFDPLACLAIAAWLPRLMRHQATFLGSGRRERLGESISVARDFFANVPAWRSLGIATVLVATMSVLGVIGFSASAESVLGADADSLQMLIGGTTFAVLVLCGLVQAVAMAPLSQHLGIPAQLLVLPLAGIVAGLLLCAGAVLHSVPLIVVAAVILGVPAWTVDDGARQTAVTLVPDHLRARVTFILDLGRFSLAPVLAGGLALIGNTLGWYWLTGILTSILAAVAIPFGLHVRRNWDDSMLSWRLRRRKRAATLGFSD